MTLASPAIRRIIACAFVFLIVWTIRNEYVTQYASALPFWDQWDAEGDELIRPWLEGTLRPDAMWALHNEHRVFPSRVLTLFAFITTGAWSNLLEARISAVLAALIAALLAWLVLKEHPIRKLQWVFIAVILACFILPFGWENFLVGFQSAFYFLVLFTILAMALAAWKPDRLAARLGVIGLCIASLATLASGMLTPIAASFVYLLAWRIDVERKPPPVIMVAALLGLAVIGYLGIPQIAGHAGLRAQGIGELLHAAMHILGWPGDGYHWTAFWLWLPGALTIAWMILQRTGSRADLMMAGCCAWSVAQALALAYGRGQGLLEVPSRYTDLLLPGLIANAWFAIRFLEHALRLRQARAFASFIAAMFFSVFFAFHAVRVEDDLAAMRERHRLSLIQVQHVSAYLATRDPAKLRQPFLHIPYPDAAVLQRFLDDPALSGALPDSIRNGTPRPPERLPSQSTP